MSNEFKQMTDEELLSVVNLKTGHYTHDELQAAREEFIRRMYSEPLIPKYEEVKEEPPKEETIHERYEDLKLSEPVKIEEEPKKISEEPVFEEPTKNIFEQAQNIDRQEEPEEDIKIAQPVIGRAESDKAFENLGQTRKFTSAETAVLEREAEQTGFFETEEVEPIENKSKLTEEDYAYYEKPRKFCSADTKLNSFCRFFVMPVVSVKMFVMLAVSLFSVISDPENLMFNLYTCTSFVTIIAQVFAWDAVENDINPIIPKILLSCELMLTLTNLFGKTYVMPLIVVLLYAGILALGIIGLFPKNVYCEHKN